MFIQGGPAMIVIAWNFILIHPTTIRHKQLSLITVNLANLIQMQLLELSIFIFTLKHYK